VKEWSPGTFAVLEANGDYVLGRPRVDEIEVRFILDPNTVVANVLAGAIDLTLGRGIALEMAMDVRSQWRDGRAEPGPTHSWLAMFPQLLDPSPLALVDVRFRRALLHGLDRQHMAEALQFGLMPVAHSFLNPKAPEYSLLATGEVRYTFDPRRAADLLAEVGYQRGADGLFRDASAQPLALELRTIDDRGIQEKSLFTIVDSWQRIGITTEGVLIPRQRQPDRPYRATFPGLEMVRQGSDLDQPARAHSAQIPLPENSFTGNNRSRYRNPTFDSLVDRYLVTIPVPDRLEIMRQIVQHMTEQVVWMGIFYDSEPMFISTRTADVAPATARPGTPAWNAHLWGVN
jgi:peptide/nickel transport system substrate-binding protein